MCEKTRSGEPERSVEQRLEELEHAIAGMRDELVTEKLVVGIADDGPRLTAKVVDGVVELRLEADDVRSGTPVQLLMFAAPGRDDLPAGAGFQVWKSRDAAAEWCSWSD